MQQNNDTKSKIIEVSLEMFSIGGYETVSVRDIAKAVGIKESSIYYHFKSKRDILNTIVAAFEQRAKELTDLLFINIANHGAGNNISHRWIREYYCDRFLFDLFCNRVMRLLMIEQLHDREMEKKYLQWMFEKPLEIQSAVLEKLGAGEHSGAFHAAVTKSSFQYLFTGPLTVQKKKRFLKELRQLMGVVTRR